MGDVTVTLEYSEHLVTVPCDRAEFPVDEDAPIPDGYVRIENPVGFDPGSGYAGTLPEIDAGSTVLVSDEHVAMIQWGADG